MSRLSKERSQVLQFQTERSLIFLYRDSSNGLLLSIAPQTHSLGITSLSVTKDGQKVLTNSLDGSIAIFRVEKSDLLPTEEVNGNEQKVSNDEPLPPEKPTLKAELILEESKKTLSDVKIPGLSGKGKGESFPRDFESLLPLIHSLKLIRSVL